MHGAENIYAPTRTLPRKYQYGMAWHDRMTQSDQQMVECKSYLATQSFCNEFNCEGGIGLVTFPQVDARPDLWEVCICDRNLLHILGVKQSTSNTRYEEHGNLSIDEDNCADVADLEHDMVAVEMHDTDPDFDPCGKEFSSSSVHIHPPQYTSAYMYRNNISVTLWET